MARALFATWTHGCSAVCENLRTPTYALYQGSGVTFTKPGGGEDWIHVPIPTPVIVQNVRARLHKVFCLFDAQAGAEVINFHVFDGGLRIGSRDGTSLTGNHLGIDDPKAIPNEFHRNWFEFGQFDYDGRPDIFFGIGVTLKVRFPTAESKFFIPTAGADLEV